jgi:hypothetical protein
LRLLWLLLAAIYEQQLSPERGERAAVAQLLRHPFRVPQSTAGILTFNPSQRQACSAAVD